MNIIVTLDEKNGMLFNHRRQSQDRVLRKRIVEICAGHKLWMNAYSARQFSDVFSTAASADQTVSPSDTCGNQIFPHDLTILVDEGFLEKATAGDFCFVENMDPSFYQEQLERIIIFRWNRRYPGDFFFTLSMDGWQLISSEDFVGSSHPKITLEIYESTLC